MTEQPKIDEAAGTAIAVAVPPKAQLEAGARVSPIIPRTIEEVARIANAVIVAGLAPDSYKGGDDKAVASKIMIGIMKGAEIGLAPLTALANIAIINGRPCLYGDGGVSLIQRSGLVEKWDENLTGKDGEDDWTAHCAIWRKGQELPYEGVFSWADAKRARLITKGPWVQHPARMMMWRARTYAMRLGFADCLCGLSIAEEIQDMPSAPAPVVADDFLTDEVAPKELSAPATPEAA